MSARELMNIAEGIRDYVRDSDGKFATTSGGSSGDGDESSGKTYEGVQSKLKAKHDDAVERVIELKRGMRKADSDDEHDSLSAKAADVDKEIKQLEDLMYGARQDKDGNITIRASGDARGAVEKYWGDWAKKNGKKIV